MNSGFVNDKGDKMKDIRLLCVVVVIGGLMGAAINNNFDYPNSWVVKDPKGKGSVILNTTDDGMATIFIYSGRDTQEDGLKTPTMSIVVSDESSIFTMLDGKNKTRLRMGVGKNGFTMISILNSKGKKVWGVNADENGVVTTYGQ